MSQLEAAKPFKSGPYSFVAGAVEATQKTREESSILASIIQATERETAHAEAITENNRKIIESRKKEKIVAEFFRSQYMSGITFDDIKYYKYREPRNRETRQGDPNGICPQCLKSLRGPGHCEKYGRP